MIFQQQTSNRQPLHHFRTTILDWDPDQNRVSCMFVLGYERYGRRT